MVEVDDFRRIGRCTIGRVAAADDHDLPWAIHHSASVVPPAVATCRHRKPGAGPANVEVGGLRQLAGVEHQAVRRHKRAGIVGENTGCAGEGAPGATSPQLGGLDLRTVLVGPGKGDHLAVR